MHVMIDEPDDDMDRLIATHIVKVHQRRERAFNVPYTMPQVQRYIKYARSIRPQLNKEVSHTTLKQYFQAHNPTPVIWPLLMQAQSPVTYQSSAVYTALVF